MKFSRYNIIIPEKMKKDILLANTFSGAVFKIDGKEREAIERKDLSYLSQDQINQYKNYGILIDDNMNEIDRLLFIHNKDKFDSTVLSLTILLTNNCNFSCTYCYEAVRKNSISLSDEIRNRIYLFISKMFELKKDYKKLNIMLFGGEPLLYFQENVEWLYRIKKLCNDNDRMFSTGIITNGSLLTSKIVEQLKQLNCNYIQFTLDGSKEVHNTRRFYQNRKGSFDDVLAAIKLICITENFVSPSIRINIDKLNLASIGDLLQNLSEEGLIKKCYIYFGILREGLEKDIKEIELGKTLEPMWELLKKYNCHFNVRPFRRSMFCGLYKESSCTIDPEGNVYKCWELVGDEDYKTGFLDERGSLQILEPYFHWMSRDFRLIEECYNCAYLPICGGGCASVSKSNYGTINSTGCLETKGIFKNQIRFLLKENK